MSGTRIVGIVLVRDEDLYVEQAVRNVSDFCDELILVDNRSRDETPTILERLAGELPHASVHHVRHPSVSHDLIAPLAGEDVWVFGVDGDELYDAAGLAAFKPRLLTGEFDEWWLLRGNAVHCLTLDHNRRVATGYAAPPSPSMTKLHNFKLIAAWDGPAPERLHTTDGLRFKPGREGRKYGLQEVYGWDESPLRALHLCFVRRSSRERAAQARRNIPDMNRPRRLPLRAWSRLREAIGVPEQSRFKLSHYREGPLVTVSAEPFLG
jgi:glycosyltransferase involved in cell wall biosynthesis